jgi:uncharacterized repeat protein (TIGR03833 family)
MNRQRRPNRQPRSSTENHRLNRPQPEHRRHGSQGLNQQNTVSSNIVPGLNVAVVQKLDQPTGRLTYGVVSQILTNSNVHPRGIKVRLMDGSVGRVQRILAPGEKIEAMTAVDEDECSSVRHRTAQLTDWIQLSGTNDDDGSRKWSCSRCTFMNSEFLETCEICEARKEQTS